MAHVLAAVDRAGAWLAASHPAQDLAGLRDRGLQLCEAVMQGRPAPRGTADVSTLAVPDIADLISWPRTKHLRFVADVTACGDDLRQLNKAQCRTWRCTFGHVILSYARGGDPDAVAGLVRAACRLNAYTPMVDRASEYLLDQQNASGSFGLVAILNRTAPERISIAYAAVMRLTVDILWAFAEMKAGSSRAE